ncbi:NAD(P)/FAD-dependent oxidoreductase [Bacillaceae bacterium SIJ1]|uniref:NAD(P)/FAD-dependent oxidoreductase n=1 Tax=Litoribacterium kuwaitense TaxID=1398745 RepID=UPI0013EAA364|nr:NAD(P)/FAD-dependent oxidoreductase [Litoribacterium kuwaitense]NGP45417.1 NAD(P)/FAD-dependent oxidoreductase [Litoribacterium kuwaitense]
MQYDCIVIGGGPAGLMAATSAALHGASVCVIEKGKTLGRKLAISGGGRCNVTNRQPLPILVEHLPGNGKFLYSAFSTYDNEAIITFFEDLGIKLKEEDRGRMFPVSNSAQDVVNALLKKLSTLKVSLRTEAKVAGLRLLDGRVQGVKLEDGTAVAAKAVIVASGGKSVPKTGSTGDGYAWAKQAGHTITELYPTEVPVTSNAPWIQSRELQGLSLQDVAVTVYSHKNKPVKTHRWDALITHFGFSGPAVLRCSQYVVKALKHSKGKGAVQLGFDTKPDQHEEDVFQELAAMQKQAPDKACKNTFKGFLQERYLRFLLVKAGIDEGEPVRTVSKVKLRQLASLCKDFRVDVNGTLSIEKAFITGGGVHLKEVDPKTMASKKMPGLFFSGEILDIHGYTGGYNITAAFVTGFCAGKAAAESRSI